MRQLFSSAVAVALMAMSGLSAATSVLSQVPVVSYTATTDGSPRGYYGYDDQGQDLTNGVMDVQVGGGYWAWSPYVLWDGHSPTITFDLGVVRQVDVIEGHFLTYPRFAVYLPLGAEVSYSTDGLSYSAPVFLSSGYTLGAPLANDAPVVLSFAAPGQGRFVRLKLQTPGRWIALSEVQLMTAVPEPSSVALALAGGGVLIWLRRRRQG